MILRLTEFYFRSKGGDLEVKELPQVPRVSRSSLWNTFLVLAQTDLSLYHLVVSVCLPSITEEHTLLWPPSKYGCQLNQDFWHRGRLHRMNTVVFCKVVVMCLLVCWTH